LKKHPFFARFDKKLESISTDRCGRHLCPTAVRGDRAGRGSTLLNPGAMRTPYATASPDDEFLLVTPPGSRRVGHPR